VVKNILFFFKTWPFFPQKMGILKKNIPSFFAFWRKNLKIKKFLYVGLNHNFQVKVWQKFANNKKTSGEDICPIIHKYISPNLVIFKKWK
jgi:hypothetical protein